MTEFCASSHYKPPQNEQMPVPTHAIFMLLFGVTLSEEMVAETNKYASKKKPVQHELAVSRTSNFVLPRVL
jgi:hypothetical protein